MVYKDEHHEVFNMSGITWPPNLEDAPEIDYHLMYPRVMELTYFVHTQYAHTAMKHAPLSIQFFDAVNSIQRAIKWNDDDCKSTVEDPWKEFVPRMT